MIDELKISGGISGAITDIYSDDALDHAELYYEEIRSFSTDVERIVLNTDNVFSYDNIKSIKDYLFIDKHDLGDEEERRFDPDFSISQSWQRLAFDPEHIQPHDIILIRHELMEMELIKAGMSRENAHIITSKEYNYLEASKKYYDNLKHKEV